MAGTLIIALAALAVDLGSVFLQSRRLQGMADLAAMAAARDLTHAQAAADATVASADWGAPVTAQVVTGVYVAKSSIAPASRFTPGGALPNAVRVTLTAPANLFFGQAIVGSATTNISRAGTAARADLAAFSVGTRLASLDGGIANSVLSALTGSSVSLSVMDYNALAGADVNLFAYSRALATKAGLTAASFDETLGAEVSTGTALGVLSEQLTAMGETKAALAVKTMAVSAGTSVKLKPSALIDPGVYGAQDRLAAVGASVVNVSAFDLAQAVLLTGQGGRQVKLDLGAGVPGLADVDVWLGIGERPANSPWLAVAQDGSTIVRTAQMRLYAETKVAGQGLLAGVAQVKLPIMVEAASAQAKLSALNCDARSAAIATQPSLGKIVIAEIDTAKLNDFQHDLPLKPASIVTLPLIKVTGSSNTQLGGANWVNLNFTEAEIAARTVKTAQTTDILKTTTGTLIGNLNLDVEVLGLGLGLGKTGILNAVGQTLSGVASPLDTVLNTLTAMAGVKLGQADVRVNGLRCKQAALVG